MTDLVMIVGVLPLVLRGGTGSELHRPLAIVYIGGFVGALLLRVFIVPVLYEAMASVFDRPGSAAGMPDAAEAPRWKRGPAARACRRGGFASSR
jgi:hypothetical protein